MELHSPCSVAVRSWSGPWAAPPDDLAVYPPPGGGSFGAAPGADDRTTTVGRERASNPLLQMSDESAFVTELLAGFGSFPAFFGRLPEVNRRGPTIYGEVPELARLGLDGFRSMVDAGAQVIDVRRIDRYAAGHVPGSLSIQLRPVFATWLGWLVDASQPVVFVLDDDQDRHDLVRQCLTVGVESLAGELDGGFATWVDGGLPVSTIDPVEPDAIEGELIDVRQADEYDAGHVPGARHVELGALPLVRVESVGRITVMCGHGERAMTGASLLERAGHHDLAVVRGGPGDWSKATGRPLAIVS